MIIDCHGHYTTAPRQLQAYRDGQIAALKAGAAAERGVLAISDDELRESVQPQLTFQRDRGTDLTIFSPRASAMSHHIGDATTSLHWSQHCNDLIYRVCGLFPDKFVGVCQLPQTPGVAPDSCIGELERCVNELGFIGCNLNPDPSGGFWSGPPLWDRYWWPLWEKMCELDVPAMIHVSASCNQNFHTTGSHYLGADTTAYMQALSSGFMGDFPGLRWIIPHGGGAVPYHWGRFKGMAQDNDWDFDSLGDHIFYDTCVYHQRGVDLLVDVVPTENILFGSEMVGAVRGIDPDTGNYYDDTKIYIDDSSLDDGAKRQVFEHNILRVYPRLAAALVGTP